MAFPFAQRFAEVEASVYRCWDRDDEDHLAGAATRALEECRELLAIDPAECLQWALDSGVALPEQSWSFDFGQPAITVVRNADFRIDLLYWVENAVDRDRTAQQGRVRGHAPGRCQAAPP
jgi:hypothetical protein